MKQLIFIFSLIFFAGCASNKEQATPLEIKEEINEQFYTGIVQEIERGKDGYTAQIRTEKGEIFFITVSISNLKEANQYKSVEPGETIRVRGEHWKMEDKNYITVREFFIVES